MKWRIAPGDKHGKPQRRISRFHRHANIEEKIGPDWGAIGEFRLRFLTDRYKDLSRPAAEERQKSRLYRSVLVSLVSPPQTGVPPLKTQKRVPPAPVPPCQAALAKMKGSAAGMP